MNAKIKKSGLVFKISAVLFVLVLTAQLTLSQQWYPGYSAWIYRVPVTLINTGEQLTDCQVQVTLGPSFPWAHSLAAGGADIRFATSDGLTEIPFWIEEWDDTPPDAHASVWVKVPSIPTGGTFVYMYYGNSSAINASNGFNTFEFFDDFETGTEPDPGRWTASGGTWSILTGVTQKNGVTGGVAQGTIPVSEKHLLKSAFSGTDYIVESTI